LGLFLMFGLFHRKEFLKDIFATCS
jgi:hypothetical protein